MKLSQRMIREQAIADCIAAVWPLMDVPDDPGVVAHAMLAALRALKSATPLTISRENPVDYLEMVQSRARAAYLTTHGRDHVGREYDATASVDTPLGRLACTTWQRAWQGPKRSRVTWASEYTLADGFVSIREIMAAGLAMRPHTRNRQKDEAK